MERKIRWSLGLVLLSSTLIAENQAFEPEVNLAPQRYTESPPPFAQPNPIGNGPGFAGAPPQGAPGFPPGVAPQGAPGFAGAPPQGAPGFAGAPPQGVQGFQGAPQQGFPQGGAQPFAGAPGGGFNPIAGAVPGVESTTQGIGSLPSIYNESLIQDLPEPPKAIEPPKPPPEVKRAEVPAKEEKKEEQVAANDEEEEENREPASKEAEAAATELLKAAAASSETGVAPAAAEVSIVLDKDQFRPKRVLLLEDQGARLYFSTVNAQPAALIISKLRAQKWVSTLTPGEIIRRGREDKPMEIHNELNDRRIVEIALTPKKGTYTYYDALSGAKGEIIVE